MYLVTRTIISAQDVLFPYFDENGHKAQALYNAALFRIRQIFIGWDKSVRSENEDGVFTEVSLLETAYPSIRVKRVISYSHLEKLMRVTENPDFFSGLPMQSAQAIIKSACEDFSNWLKALRAYKRDPSGFLGKPKMPGYKKPGLSATYTITNQDALVYGTELKLPRTKLRLRLGGIPESSRLMECRIKPYYGRYLVCLTFETSDIEPDTDMPNIAAIDLGVDNIAAIVCTDGSSRLYKGGAILAENQLFAKRKATAVSDLTRGHKNRHYPSTARMRDMSFHHANFDHDQCHKISRSIINYCTSHRAGLLVLGTNKGWKQKACIGAANNQSFVGMPIAILRAMITYKAQAAGITVIEQEESYTSKADFLLGDHIPTYGKDDADASFSGKRIGRGLYRSGNGTIINADLNGAANILRKAIPDAWDRTKDYSFLNDPEVLGFHELNPQSIPAKRIAAA